MARIRTIKPEFFFNERLAELEAETGLPIRLAYIGLWCQCDREGRFEWRPTRLKAQILPYDDADFAMVLDGLMSIDCIECYEVGGKLYGQIPSWHQHQSINQREAQSKIPAPGTKLDGAETHMRAYAEHSPVNVPPKSREKVFQRDGHRCRRCGSTDDLTIDHIFPQSIGGTHAIENLRTLCRSCNSARPVQGDALVEDLKIDGLSMEDMKRICTHMRARGEGKGKEGNKKGGAAQKAPTPTPDGVDPKAWQDFDQHRRSTSKLRSTWNDLAKTKAANLLRQLTPDQQREIVDYSVTGGYPGLFPDRATKSVKTNEPHYPDLQA